MLTAMPILCLIGALAAGIAMVAAMFESATAYRIYLGGMAVAAPLLIAVAALALAVEVTR